MAGLQLLEAVIYFNRIIVLKISRKLLKYLFTQNCFLGHNFWTRNARNPIKGSKDSDCSLVSTKNLRQNWLLWLEPRALWPQPKMPKPTPLMISPTKHTKPKPGLPKLFSVAGHFRMRKCEKIYCGPQTFLWCNNKLFWCNKSLDFDTFYKITQGDYETYSCTQCCQLVWM